MWDFTRSGRPLLLAIAGTIMVCLVTFQETRPETMEVVDRSGTPRMGTTTLGRTARRRLAMRAGSNGNVTSAVMSTSSVASTAAVTESLTPAARGTRTASLIDLPLDFTQRSSAREFWREGSGARFNALAAYGNVCVLGADRVASLPSRERWAATPAGATEGTRLMADDTTVLRAATVEEWRKSGQVKYVRGLTLLPRRPHGRNIAHAFVEAMFLTLHALRHIAEGTLSAKLALLKNSAPSSVSVLHHPVESYAAGFAHAVNRSTWNEGAFAAALFAAGIPESGVMPNPVIAWNGAPSALKALCFEELLVVGTSREMCVDAACQRSKYKPRDDTLRWISKLAVVSGGAPTRQRSARPLRVGVYLREDQNQSKLNRRVRDGRELIECVSRVVNGSSLTPQGADVEFVHIPRVPRHWGPQARLWATFDVLLAAAGAANTNALWMPEPSGVVVLAGCSQAYLSWMATTRLPDQDVVTFKLCTKKAAKVVFEKPEDGGIRIPCSTALLMTGGRLRVTLPEALLHELRRRLSL
jgi:hypothetical protein